MTIPHPQPQERGAELLLMVVVLIWALNAPLVKYGLSGLDIFVFNGIRYTVAFLLLAAIFFYRSSWTPIEPHDWPRLIWLGVVANIFYQLFYVFGIKLTTAGNSAVLLSTSPLWTAFFNWRLHKERVMPQAWLGMTISLIGIVMIIIGSGQKLEFGSHALYGDLLSLGSAMLWALNTNLQKSLLKRYPAIQVTLISTGVGELGLAALALPSATSLHWSSIQAVFYLVPLISGASSIAIASALWSYGVKIIGPRRTANYSNLIPVIAFIAAYILLKEQVFVIQAVGAGVTVLGVAIARR